jgi:hypothetical protein
MLVDCGTHRCREEEPRRSCPPVKSESDQPPFSGVLVAEGREGGLVPQNPAIDALGRVWYVVGDRGAGTRRTGIVADSSTGAILEEFQYFGDVIDQNFDATGSWLVITLADGTVEWRSLTPASSIPAR